MDIDSLIGAVERRQDELLALLSDLVRFETPAPPARNTDAAQDHIEGLLKGLGFSTDRWELHPGDSNVVGTLKGSAPGSHRSLIVNGHVDVAEVHEDEPWETGPFDPFIRDGRIFGRGTSDMKGGIAGVLFALKLLREAGWAPKGDLFFEAVTGEEVGEPGTLECHEHGYKADYAVVVDTSDLVLQGQGGVITGWVTVRSKATHHDGTRAQMIHAGGGLKGASAIEKMMKIIAGLQELERHWAVTKSFPGMAPGSNTINPAVIEGGRHAAFVADECRLWITVHFLPDERHEDIVAEIEAHLAAVAAADPWLRENPPVFEWGGRSMIIDRGEIFPALNLDRGHAATQLLSATHQAVLAQSASFGISPSVSDGGWFGHVGIPAVVYGPGTLKEAHAVNESVEIAQLIDFTKVMLRFMVEWLDQPKS
ncbi:acetylornithine deacetylase [Paenirhodobacter populi]|uniref:Acetylornithine deacetylase n=1 Tax=Paenirhodobacter populi TaxID=2306993 RepID=A0A443JIU8_9RHOB|nr:acetylornithine deacetylase [Sinirhodobacter populi]RWR09537.1 acetylornithine deacetylase [Sinirhodobacter populi]RWR20478.1 acetylornithine deacetylase [Sinirhodobacter populi]